MDLFILIETPVLGELGPQSKIIREKACETCGRLDVKHQQLEFKFDRWNGEDLISAYGLYFMSERLKNAVEAAGLKGMRFQAVQSVKAETFKLGKKAYQAALPTFYHLKIVGKAKGPDIWHDNLGVCDHCRQNKWWPTPEGIRSGNGPSSTGTKKDVENPLKRRVYPHSWQGDDLFYLQDPVMFPIATSRFRDLTLELNNTKLFFRKTSWVNEDSL